MAVQGSRRYRPLPIAQPATDVRTLSQWVAREFQRVADALEAALDVELSTNAPEKPQDGMVRYADGTYWNPDLTNGEGFYGYWADAWHYFGGTGGGSVTYGSASGLANSNVNGIAASVSRSDHQHKRDVRVYHSNESQTTRDEIGTRNALNFVDTEDTLEATAQGWIAWTITDDGTQDEIEVLATVHIPSDTPAGLGNSADAGESTSVALADHVHKRDVRVAKAGTDVGTRNRLNFIEGSNVTLTVADDSGNDEVDITVAASGATGKRTIWIPAAAIVPRTTNGAAVGTVETSTNKIMVRTLDFDKTTDEYGQFTVRMPKSWNESTVTAQFVWSSNVSGTGSVVWGLQGVALDDDDALDTAFGTAQTVTDAQTAQGDVMLTAETSAITIGNSPSAEDFVVFQVYRDADTNVDGDARLHGVVVIYTTDAATDD